ncbi:MAG: glycoside hydrolase family 13 protein [Vulcanibacillus sp.]
MKQWIYHDSHNLNYRNPFGATSVNQNVVIHLRITGVEVADGDKVILIYWEEGNEKKEINMQLSKSNGNELYRAEIIGLSYPGLIWYMFAVSINSDRTYYGKVKENYGGVGVIADNNPLPYQITFYDKKNSTPNWYKDAIMYQIFVDRFYNGNEDGKVLNPKENSLLHSQWDNDPIYIKDKKGKIIYWDFFGGNLLGVKKKLSYLKELGVDIIYFNPVFESSSNHKYDTGDYHKIDPMYGDNQLFKELCKEASQLGISIILDGVFSHTGSDSKYFNKEGRYEEVGAYQSTSSPCSKWYCFQVYPNIYDSWWGIDVLPNVNELEPSYLDFIVNSENSVVRYWQGQGIKGWRLDVADELPDEFIRILRNKMKELDNESIILGEVWEDASNKISYGSRRRYLYGDELDSVTNYPFREAIKGFLLGYIDANKVYLFLMTLYENYPLEHFYSTMNLIGSHDTPRILSMFRDKIPEYMAQECKKIISIKRLKLATLIQFTFPGVPLIYYGDEVGLEGNEEPLNRRTYPWGKENTEILEWYKQVTKLRKTYNLFSTGKWIPFYTNEDVFGYIRLIENNKDVFMQEKENNLAIVLCNRSINNSFEVKVNLNKLLITNMNDLTEVTDIMNGEKIYVKQGNISTTLEPLEGKIYMQYVKK